MGWGGGGGGGPSTAPMFGDNVINAHRSHVGRSGTAHSGIGAPTLQRHGSADGERNTFPSREPASSRSRSGFPRPPIVRIA